jgi:enoyl-CoA hydratase
MRGRPARQRAAKGEVMSEYQFALYEELDEGRIARVMLNRPDTRNAQSRGLLVALNDALLRAEADDQVRVVILGADRVRADE